MTAWERVRAACCDDSPIFRTEEPDEYAARIVLVIERFLHTPMTENERVASKV